MVARASHPTADPPAGPACRGEHEAQVDGPWFVAVGPGRDRIGVPRLEPTVMLRMPSDDTPLFPVQPAKVQRPPLRDETLSRERLLDWLSAKIHHRVVHVIAEAGYGKTTLLADFSRRTRVRTLWYRLDEQDRDPVAFLNYLVAAGREHVPEFAPTTAALLRELGSGGVSHETLVATLVRELPGLGHEGGALILDDYHLVDDVPEIRSIVQALLRDGPDRLTLVLLSRRQPRLAVARLRTQGEVAELFAEDLRFRADETERLFREGYRRPLEPDVLDELSRRTEGWAASLQLVSTALRGRSPAEARAFVRTLTGTHHELYDYLAEEVVADLDPSLQEFLMRTSVLQVVEPDLAAVAAELGEDDARHRIEEAERVGLLGRRGQSEWSHRYHPLVQQFLVERLTRAVGRPAVLELHRKIARHTEAREWRIAVHHWAAAGDGADVRRVLEAAIPSVMGTGEFALAESYLERFPAPERTPAFEVLLSRLDFYRNRIETALERARWAAEEANQPVAVINLAALEFMAGHIEESASAVDRLGRDTEPASASVRDIAEGMRQIIASGNDGDLDVFVQTLDAILSGQLSRGETHYAGVTALNLSIALRQQARQDEAEARSTQAIELLSERALGPELASAFGARAWTRAHRGDLAGADVDLQTALTTQHDLSQAELHGEAAEIYAWYGSLDRADDELERSRALSEANPVLWVSWKMAAAEIAVRRRDWQRARSLVSGLSDAKWYGTTGQRARLLTLLAYVELGEGTEAHRPALDRAIKHAAKQKAHLWSTLCRVLSAADTSDVALGLVVSDLIDRDAGLACVLADRIVTRLGDLDGAVHEQVRQVAHRRPEPWRHPLRLTLTQGDAKSRVLAARLLDEIGEPGDVARLRAFVRSSRRSGPDSELGRSLARRLAPRIVIEDLGRTELVLGDSRVAGASIRRKVLALLLFLTSRPDQSATHDQVLDALWPEQAPKEGLNSLNQTIYFLRRVLEPDYAEETSPEYLHHRSDLLWLDSQLVTSRSQRVWSLIVDARRNLLGTGVESLPAAYAGQFALDFAYEDWAQGYRDRLHAAVIEVLERAALARLNSQDFAGALRLADAATTVDPTAEALHVLSIRLCRLLGAHAAAAERYATYAAYVRSELGVDPEPLEEI